MLLGPKGCYWLLRHARDECHGMEPRQNAAASSVVLLVCLCPFAASCLTNSVAVVVAQHKHEMEWHGWLAGWLDGIAAFV